VTRAPRGALCLLLAAGTAGCATTVTDSARGGDTPPTTVPITAPSFDDATPTAELFELLAEAAGRVATAMADGDRDAARAHLAVLEAVGQALAPRVAAASDQLAADLARVLDLARSAVERNRPADADKAVRFLPLVAAAAAGLGLD
jgi:hypothetical protein